MSRNDRVSVSAFRVSGSRIGDFIYGSGTSRRIAFGVWKYGMGF